MEEDQKRNYQVYIHFDFDDFDFTFTPSTTHLGRREVLRAEVSARACSGRTLAELRRLALPGRRETSLRVGPRLASAARRQELGLPTPPMPPPSWPSFRQGASMPPTCRPFGHAG